ANIPKSIGTDRKVLVREAYSARLAVAGCSGGVWPSFVQVINFCCAGQMMNHTLNHMMVPKSAPRVIHNPGSVVKSPLSPVKPLPSRKYFQRIRSKPERKVYMAPQRNHHKARGMSCGTTSLRVGGCSAAVTWALMRLKK